MGTIRKFYADGATYTDRATKDVWQRVNGAWQRIGNVRDEGTGGIVGVAPIVNMGFAISAQLTRTQFLGSVLMDLGFSNGVDHVDRIRLLTANFGVGLGVTVALQRIRRLAASNQQYGYNISALLSVVSSGLEEIAASLALGFNISAAVTHITPEYLAASFDFGFSQSVGALTRSTNIAASMAFGFSQSTALSRTQTAAGSFAYGFAMSVALTHNAPAVPQVGGGVNETKSYTATAPSGAHTITGVATDNANGVFVLFVKFSRKGGYDSLASVSGGGATWTLANRIQYNPTASGSVYYSTLEIWVGKGVGAAGSKANIVATPAVGTGTIALALDLKTFYNLNTTTPIDVNANAVKSVANSAITSVTPTMSLSSTASSGIIVGHLISYNQNKTATGYTNVNTSQTWDGGAVVTLNNFAYGGVFSSAISGKAFAYTDDSWWATQAVVLAGL